MVTLVNTGRRKSVRELAVNRLFRLFSSDLSSREIEEIGSWQKGASDYQQEFLGTAHLLADMEKIADSPAIQAILNESVADQPRWSVGRSWSKLAIAASIAASLTLGVFFFTRVDRDALTGYDDQVMRYITRIGEQKNVDLPDGSQITLNTGTELLVNYTDTGRNVTLKRGEAWFEVTADSLRPFSVDVGPRTISVLGTAFNVRKMPEQFTLAVVEGVVSLRKAAEPADKNAPLINTETGQNVQINAPGQHRLTAGWVVEFDTENNTLTAYVGKNLQALNSWRTGLVSFEGEALFKVIQELNRYSAKKILIEDMSIMDIKVNAGVRVDQINNALASLERAYPIKVVHDFDRIMIRKRGK